MSKIPTSKKEFLTEFVSRTKTNLENYNDQFDMTNIINCSLGMIIFPCEYEKKRKSKKSLWKKPARDVIKNLGCKVYKFKPIKKE